MPKASKKKDIATVILFRLSALGDVAMTLPFVYEACQKNPKTRFVFVTQAFPSKLFVDPPENLETIVFSKKEDKLLPFAFRLHRLDPKSHIIDLHAVPRTKWLSLILRLLGHRVTSLVKPRGARQKLLKRVAQPSVPKGLYVPPITRLYSETLSGGDIQGIGQGRPIPKAVTEKKIGLALFAQHEGKMLLPTQEEELVALLSQSFPDYEVKLYGANETYELQRRHELSSPYPNVSVSSHKRFEEEMREISSLACMISMDSANQHIARFLGVPVVSIWMQTHPAAGFLPYGMPESDCIGIDLDCRPCSIYGNKPCRRRDWACKRKLDLHEVIEKTRLILLPD